MGMKTNKIKVYFNGTELPKECVRNMMANTPYALQHYKRYKTIFICKKRYEAEKGAVYEQ